MAEVATVIAAIAAVAGSAKAFMTKPKTPKPDEGALAAQNAELGEQKRRAAELEAEKGASARANNSRSLGRQLLSYTPPASSGATTLGGGS